MQRRNLLKGLSGLAALGAGTAWPGTAMAQGSDFRALVVVMLKGGLDGHNVLVPGDDRYAEYSSARGRLALARNTLVDLPGTVAGRRFAMHPGLQNLLPAYQSGRMAFLANVGPLVRPVTAAGVRAGTAEVPPMLGSHRVQSDWVQGALMDNAGNDGSGWGGRTLEALPAELQHARAAVALGVEHRLVHGRRTAPSLRSANFSQWWPMADLTQRSQPGTQAFLRQAAQQSANTLKREYARTLAGAIDDNAWFHGPYANGTPDPAGDFGNGPASHALRRAAKLMPYARQQGLRRQIYLVTDPSYDTTHRDTLHNGGHSRLPELAKALSAFDAAINTAGLASQVVTLVMSEMGRTLRPFANSEGSERGWGNHWWLLGNPVAGGTVHGSFPSLVLGGADDGSSNAVGRLVPSTASDQVAATLAVWLGLPASRINEVFPNLATFTVKTLPLLRA
jgi:uncharacterized protein (DUF1501 family)